MTASKACHYDIIWGTGHACANNDVITKECKFSNGEVSFDLTKLEKPKKELSYGVKDGAYQYRIKVCSNGQPCGTLLRLFRLIDGEDGHEMRKAGPYLGR